MSASAGSPNNISIRPTSLASMIALLLEANITHRNDSKIHLHVTAAVRSISRSITVQYRASSPTDLSRPHVLILSIQNCPPFIVMVSSAPLTEVSYLLRRVTLVYTLKDTSNIKQGVHVVHRQ